MNKPGTGRTITFIYSDGIEKLMMEMIAERAKDHGYATVFTMDKSAKCDIGFYCQHINFPENSKFSLIMLHDIIQQYSNWPDIWFREPWNKYDIGFLPGERWKENWLASSHRVYARPRKGAYVVGWPKADAFVGRDMDELRAEYSAKFGLDPAKKTILYAPAWENDGKEDDFVRAMLPLGVNILIKHAPWDAKKWPWVVENIRKMNEMHRDIPGVTILDPKVSIMEAICACDILVSEESSTMGEATMLGKPAVSVYDWLIPDQKPSRFPADDYDFVNKTAKAKLGKTVNEILLDLPSCQEKAKEDAKRMFGLEPGVCERMIEILDEVLATGGPAKGALTPMPEVPLDKKTEKAFKKEQRNRRFVDKYVQHCWPLKKFYGLMRRVRALFKRKKR